MFLVAWATARVTQIPPLVRCRNCIFLRKPIPWIQRKCVAGSCVLYSLRGRWKLMWCGPAAGVEAQELLVSSKHIETLFRKPNIMFDALGELFEKEALGCWFRWRVSWKMKSGVCDFKEWKTWESRAKTRAKTKVFFCASKLRSPPSYFWWSCGRGQICGVTHRLCRWRRGRSEPSCQSENHLMY